ncbi:sugar phosphate isomerase/epimerase [Microbacterium lushaniae]|nr:sugar phosphate isomerase/epimerase [Microbacterium lushaniae]KAA9157358.1 sugar phosphate isomerase/epimerase [Microbacterium lushaniae]
MSTSAPSVQLYTVREALASDLPGTLDSLAALGFTQVEPFGLPDMIDRLAPELERLGLSAPTTHAGFVDADAAGRARVFDAAERIGVRTVIDPFIAPERWQSADDIRVLAERLATAAGEAAGRGLRVGYHNHDHELAATIDGMPALEFFAAILDDRVVLEVDTYWALVGGVDPVALLQRLGERVVAIHVKDGPVPGDVADQTPLGQGAVPIPEVLAAAPDALRVLELDESRIPPIEALAESLRFLRTLESGAESAR